MSPLFTFQALYQKLFVLLDKYLDNQNSINNFIEETKLTENVKDEYIVKILCTELLHGRKSLPSIENNTMMTVNKAFENHLPGMFLKFMLTASFVSEYSILILKYYLNIREPY